MLLDTKRDFGLLLLHLARFFVVFVLRNTLVEAQVEERSEPVAKVVILATEALDSVPMKLAFGLVTGLHVREQRIQQFRRNLYRSEHGLDLIEDRAFGDEEFLIRLSRVAADQIGVPPLLDIAGH